MAESPQLNARQRKHVHMHSSIFSNEGPESKSLYVSGQQEKLYESLKGTLREYNNKPPEISLPSAKDIRCTQNAGHAGVVIPGDRGGAEQPGTPRTRRTNESYLVYDGEAKEVVRSAGKDQAIPQEFWQTSVNLQWHDARNERCRQTVKDRQDLGAQEMRLREMSSEIFGKERRMQASTTNPRQEIVADTVDYLQLDSQFHERPAKDVPPSHGGTAALAASPTAAAARCQQNLSTSAVGLGGTGGGAPAPARAAWQDQDPANAQRRRQEKNFSDLFDTQMGERKVIRGNREELLASKNCSFLDSRSEVAARNKGHWRHDENATAANRKDAETTSSLFGNKSPERPPMDQDVEHTRNMERVCWSAKDGMLTGCEVARRRVAKDFKGDFVGQEGQTHLSRKQDDLASNQMRNNFRHGDGGGPGVAATPAPAPAPVGRGRPAPWSPPVGMDRRSAKDTKLASLQSSIFAE